MGKSSPADWSGWSAALSKCLKDAGGTMDWSDVRNQLVESYTEEVGDLTVGTEDFVGNVALASIPDSYLSKEDSMIRLPKRAAEDCEAEETQKTKKTKTDTSGEDKENGSTDVEFKVFIKGLPYSVDEASLRKDFAECGEILKLQLPMGDEGKPKGFAFIYYATREGLEAALKYDNTDYGGRYINVSKANESGKGKDSKGKGKGKEKGGLDNENTVFIRGLPFSITEDALRKDFAECGEIVSLKMPLNEEGKPRGISFIKFTSQEGVDAALKFDNTDYGGRTINVSKAEAKGKGKDSKGKDGKGKDGKDKGKGKKGKGKGPSESKAKSSGCIVEGAGEKKTFDDSDDD